MTTTYSVSVHAKERGTGRGIDLVLNGDDTAGNALADPTGSTDIILSSDKPVDIVQFLYESASVDVVGKVDVFANGNATGKQLQLLANTGATVNPQVSYVQPIPVKAGAKLAFIQRAK